MSTGFFGDANGVLNVDWIGVCSDVLPGKRARFTVKDGLPNDHIWALAEGADAGLWVGTDRGLCLLDRTTGKVVTYGGEAGVNAGFPHEVVRALRIDRRGTLWVGFERGFGPFDVARILLGLAVGLSIAVAYVALIARWTAADIARPIEELRANMARAESRLPHGKLMVICETSPFNSCGKSCALAMRKSMFGKSARECSRRFSRHESTPMMKWRGKLSARWRTNLPSPVPRSRMMRS